MPATAAFCTSSKLARPLTSSTAVEQRRAAGEELGADQFVQGVVPADVLAQGQQVAAGVEQRRGVQAAGAIEDGLRRPQRLGQTVDHRASTTGRPSDRRWRAETRSASSDALPQTPQLDDV